MLFHQSILCIGSISLLWYNYFMFKFFQNKKVAAFVSICSNSFLIILKFIVGIISGSVSILSEAIHSVTDLIASVIAFYSVKVSSEPADDKHPFGHGKFEDISGFIEGFLLLVAAGYILMESIEKLTTKNYDFTDVSLGILVMFVSVVLNIFVSFYLFQIAKKQDSMALFADAQHLRMDIYTSVGVLVGLILIKITGLVFLDPLIAILISLMIVKAGIDICKTTANNLLDTSIPKEEQKAIKKILKKYRPGKIIKIKKLKTRKAGNSKLIEAVLIVPESLTIKEGHDFCDLLEDELKQNINISSINIHLEPCDYECCECKLYHHNNNHCEELKNKRR